MAIYDVQYIKHSLSGLPEDDIVSTLHFLDNNDEPLPSHAHDLATFVTECHYHAIGDGTYLETFIGPDISRVTLPTVKVYDGENPGSALAVVTQAAMRASGAGGYNLPAEVALCLSFRSDYGDLLEEGPDDLDADSRGERPRARVRGRIFEGPFGTDAVKVGVPGRPADKLVLGLLDFAERLAAVSEPAWAAEYSTRWVVTSKAGAGNDAAFFAANEVRYVWVDNEWDTQRRRGRKANERTASEV